MKDLSAGLLAHLAQEVTAIATGWKVTQVSGGSYGWTDHDIDAVIDGVTYRASQGLSPTTAHSTNDFSVDTLDVTAFLDETTEAEISAGVWDDATVTVFEYRWESPPSALDDEVNILRHGRLGPIKRQHGQFTAEIRGLADRLATRIGRAYGPTCPWRHAIWNGTTFVSSVECGVDLTGGGFIKTGTATSVGANPRLDFGDSTQEQEAGYFDEGYLIFTSGRNTGYLREVRRWENGEFHLYRPLPYPVETMDTYTAVRGDDKQFSTCKTVFNNVVNATSGGFGGHPHLKGNASVYATPPGL